MSNPRLQLVLALVCAAWVDSGPGEASVPVAADCYDDYYGIGGQPDFVKAKACFESTENWIFLLNAAYKEALPEVQNKEDVEEVNYVQSAQGQIKVDATQMDQLSRFMGDAVQSALQEADAASSRGDQRKAGGDARPHRRASSFVVDMSGN